MSKTVFQVAAAVAAAAIVLLVVAVSNSLDTPIRWLLVAGSALVALGAAWWAARHIAPDRSSSVDVGNDIRSGEDVQIEDVSTYVSPEQDQSSRIANRLRSKGGTRISRIDVGKQRKPEE